MKKNSDLHLKLSSEQKKLLQDRALACGLSLSAYCSFLLLNALPSIVKTED